MAKTVSQHSSDPVRQAARSYIAELRAKRLSRRGIGAEQETAAQTQAKAQAKPQHADTKARSTTPKIGKRGVRSPATADAQASRVAAGDSVNDHDALRASVLAELHDISGKPEDPAGSAPKPQAKTARAKKPKPEPKPPTKTQPTAKASAPKAPKDDTSSSPSSNRDARLEARQKARSAIRSGAEQARAAAHEAQQKIRAARLTQRAAAAKQKAHLQAAKAKRDANKTGTPTAGSETAQQPRRRWVPQRSAGAHSQPQRAQTTASKTPAKAAKQSPHAAVKTRSAPRQAKALTALHGIGDAMNRRLERAGICSTDDLVALSPATIRDRLGPVSALANIEGWQAEAANGLPK